MWISVDDTDGPRGGCTTFVLTEIVREARDLGFDLLGYPRLVRLNPNVPWRTRGNAALAARFGHGRGRPIVVGSIGGEPVRAYPTGRSLTAAEAEMLASRAWAATERSSVTSAETDPALVASERRPGPGLYRRAVSEIVPLREARRALRSAGARSRTLGSPQGLVGAAAALAWPGRRRTFELIAYRRPGREGRPRQVDPASVREAARRLPSLAHNFDPVTRRLLVAPHTPCPILFGLRGRRALDLPKALATVRSEAIDRWLLFATNQGTGDHLVARPLERFPPLASGRVTGVVRSAPVVRRGGHVAFEVADPTGRTISCVAFEPTKSLPRVAASLRPGDRVEVAGGRSADGALHLERIQIRRLAPRFGAPRIPPCDGCGRRPESVGTGRGFRCRRCHRRFAPEHARPVRVPPTYARGTYEPTMGARRHLHPWPAPG